jgi:hypothetical protein
MLPNIQYTSDPLSIIWNQYRVHREDELVNRADCKKVSKRLFSPINLRPYYSNLTFRKQPQEKGCLDSYFYKSEWLSSAILVKSATGFKKQEIDKYQSAIACQYYNVQAKESKQSKNKLFTYLDGFFKSTNNNGKQDKSHLLLAINIDSLKDRKSVANKYNDLNVFLQSIDQFSIRFGGDAQILSEQVQLSIQKQLKVYKKSFNHVLLKVLSFLRKKGGRNKGIGKDVEGFIAFVTWARPPSVTQLVNKYHAIDKLSQVNFNRSEIYHGC